MKTSSKVFWTAIIALSTVLLFNSVTQGDSQNSGNNNASSQISFSYFK